MNKWLHPSKRRKTEDESAPQDATTHTSATSFDTIKKQVGKKMVSRKSKKERIANKIVLLADKVRYQTYN
jgi:hypothetical protein